MRSWTVICESVASVQVEQFRFQLALALASFLAEQIVS
jgi:hypothetical protein